MYTALIQHFAEGETQAKGDILSAFGVDVRLLVLQTVAFLVLVWALKKWVYPVFIKAIDDRQAALDAGLKASQAAQEQAEEAEKRVSAELAKARKQADDIIASTQKEANSIITDAEEKAGRRAETIVADAKADMRQQLQAAQDQLKVETRKLVAEATAEIIGEKLDGAKDAALVDSALKHAASKAA